MAQLLVENGLQVFDAVCPSGAASKPEFATLVQKEIVDLLKKGVMMGGAMGVLPYFQQFMPVAVGAVETFDSSHLKTLVEMLFRIMDANNNGKVEKQEFKEFLEIIPAIAGNSQALFDYLFKMMDVNGNGTISRDEAEALSRALFEIVTTLAISAANVVEFGAQSAAFVDFLKGGITTLGVFGQIGGDAQNQTLSKAQFVTFLTSPLGEGAPTPLALFATSLGQVAEEQKSQLRTQMEYVRTCLAEFEANVGAQFYMAAMEWTAGGVDEATFISRLVPILQENVTKQWEDPSKMINASLKMYEANPQTAAMVPMVKQVFEAMQGSEEWKPAIGRAQEKASQYMPDCARTIFKFLDIDGSGNITSKEIGLLRHFMDALLNIGQRAIAKPGEISTSAKGSAECLAKDLAVAVFEIVDKDGDGEMTQAEVIGFLQKAICFLSGMVKVMAEMVVECFYAEFAKVLICEGWKRAGLKDEMKPDEVMGFVMSAPMLMLQMMQPQQGTGPPGNSTAEAIKPVLTSAEAVFQKINAAVVQRVQGGTIANEADATANEAACALGQGALDAIAAEGLLDEDDLFTARFLADPRIKALSCDDGIAAVADKYNDAVSDFMEFAMLHGKFQTLQEADSSGENIDKAFKEAANEADEGNFVAVFQGKLAGLCAP